MESESSRKLKNRIEPFDEPLEQPGKIFLAEIHGSAQRLLKVKKLSKYIRFCQCCLLPSETPGVVMPYTCLDNRKEFGLGIHLYFYFIQFCLIICFISFCLSSIPTMVFSIRYTNQITDHCNMYYNSNDTNFNITINRTNLIYNPQLITNNTKCYKYLKNSISEIETDLSNIIQTDWILKMSTDNLNNYYEIFQGSSKNINSILLDFSFLYFLTSITLLIINFFFVHYVNLSIDKEDFQETSPRDYTILVHGVKRPKNNSEMTRKEHLRSMLNEISKDYFKLEIYDIIPCYNLVKLYKLSKNLFEDRVKIYHAHNFQKQKDLHNKYILSKGGNPYHYQTKLKGGENKEEDTNNSFPLNEISHKSNQLTEMVSTNQNNLNNIGVNNLNTINNNIEEENLNYYKKYLWYIKAIPLKEIEERIVENKKKINEIEKDIYANPDKYNCGTYFVIFKYISMRDKIYSFYPTNLSTKFFMRIKYLFQNILCGCCTSEKTKRANYLKTAFTIEHATEAYEVLWQNLGYSFKERYFYLMLSVIATIILIGISLGIVVGLNEAQYRITEKETNKDFLRYFLSFLISISIAIINSIGRAILKKITKNFEAIETKTDYYISLSIKITLFTFLNTAIVPLISNYLRGVWGENDILINNLLMIFITNITLTPFVFYFAPPLWLKFSRRAKARMDLEGLSLAESKYTQGELNKIFENPSMDLSYKYSYFFNTLLTSLFYMSVFPLGTVFCIVALILSYFFEIFYLGFYKRPEVLNARLCKFFVQNFKIVICVFCIGNYIFLSSISEYYRTNWSLINLILFIVIAFIPYHSIKINFLGTTEGETSKGSYDEYALMFPTDYEKENPLTKKRAMIKHFNKLREMNIIDKYQCEYLIKDIQKETAMDNYYKTSKNVGKILSSYEFQRQFVHLKKKYKFIREVRRKQSTLNKYDINLDDEYRKRGYSVSRFSIYNKARMSVRRKGTNISNKIHNEEDKEDNNLGYNKNYNVNILPQSNRYNQRRKTSTFMRETLFQRIKDEGIYSESEEESESDSYENESQDATSSRKKVFDFDASSHSKKSDDKKNNSFSEKNNNRNNNGKINTIREDENDGDISSSVDTEYRDYVKNLKKKGGILENIQNTNNNNNTENFNVYSLKESKKNLDENNEKKP